jgi:hypothetical protein
MRNDDVAKTNTSIIDYIILDNSLFYDKDEYPLPGKTDYSERGCNHPEYASLLYPMASHDHLNPEEIAYVFLLTCLLSLTKPSPKSNCVRNRIRNTND